MRVLHVASWYPANPGDIAGVFVREHVRCLAAHVQQHVVAPAIDGDDLTQEDDGFTVSRPRVPSSRGRWLVPYLSAVGHAAAAFRPELLHGHVSRPAGVACRWVSGRLGLPYLVTEHTAPFSALLESHVLNRAAARWALRGAQAVTAVSRHHADEIDRRVSGVVAQVVPNTVDVARFECRSSGGGGPVRLLFVGRLVPQKGCDVLLAALAQLGPATAPWQLAIVGDGPERFALERQARPLGGRVEFLGSQPPASIPAIMSAADVLVLPSRWESFGVVLIEALAAGLPVLSTSCGGPDDIVTDEVGRLVPVEDAAALAGGVSWMISHHRSFDPSRLRAIAQERYSFEVVARRFLDLYGRALGRPSAAS